MPYIDYKKAMLIPLPILRSVIDAIFFIFVFELLCFPLPVLAGGGLHVIAGEIRPIGENISAPEILQAEISFFAEKSSEENHSETTTPKNAGDIKISQNTENHAINDSILIDKIREQNSLRYKKGKLPQIKPKRTSKAGHYIITAYSSEVAQCDASPCITANGFNVCKHGIEDTIAANFLPFGTRVKIPELFGDRVFIVRDRMNKRFSDRVDIWMKEKPSAIKFGAKYTKIEVLGS